MDLSKETVNKIRELILFVMVVMILGINYQRPILLFGRLPGMLPPFLMGATITFILNVPTQSIEKRLMTGRESGFGRPVSLYLTLLVMAGVLGLATFVVIPELVRTVMTLQNNIPTSLNEVGAQSEQLFIRYPEVADYINGVEVDWKQVMEDTIGSLSSGAGTVLNGTLSAASSTVDGVMGFGIGFIFIIYILLQKENLVRQMKKLVKAFLPAAVSTETMETAALVEKTSSSFLTDQYLEAVILDMMFFITLNALRMPYALLIGALIAFTVLIPVFDAFIGYVVGTFLMLVINPVSVVTFVTIFLVFQQVEGDLIYLHVVGNSVELPSIWVLMVAILDDSAFGAVGMLVFIPLRSVFYSLLRQEVNERLNKNRPPTRPVKRMTRVKKPGEKN